jgi:hypothetical protein
VKAQQPLTLVADPRVLAAGVSPADLVAQYAHNLRVLELVNDTNVAVARVKAAQAALKQQPDAAKQAALQAIAAKLLTPAERYSPPGLDTHVNYLRSQTDEYDGQIGNHPKERLIGLRKQIDDVVAQLDRLLGPSQAPTGATGG